MRTRCVGSPWGCAVNPWVAVAENILDFLFTRLTREEAQAVWDAAAKRRAQALFEAEKNAKFPLTDT